MAKIDPYSKEGMQLMTTLLEEIEGQSDRGAAIVGVAWVEETITAALESFLQPAPTSWKRLFTGNGPLANFSSKIDLCRLLGLVTEGIRSDLHALRDIRNEFAHQVAHKTHHTKLAFTSQHINDRCLALKCVAHESHTNPRHAFMRACAVLFADFDMVVVFGTKVSGGGVIFARSESGGEASHLP